MQFVLKPDESEQNTRCITWIYFLVGREMKMDCFVHRETLHYLIIGELVPWLFSISEDLPQNHTQTPDVALCGELSVHDAFRRHPADWQHCVTSDL